ncbi:uncharacterized protein EDB91DRAFT_1126364 [Suillus paluster]|uniref:uncharacterized protein n=1 Tax=Suillus paluster TaxID=48578 RepID=UPI001B86AB76|nr:uncharacterized protein EDB91DRAFT_1126364 [Suillus paluster]KAG1743227.1 hypothetical protein EDB91DRAFT_1126364 [Suillus paluster]
MLSDLHLASCISKTGDLCLLHISITDDEVLVLVSAWPQMGQLSLGSKIDWGVPHSGVTLRGLAGISERCPHLCSLGVNLDTSAPSYLSVGYGECNDVEAIDNLLSAMCPNLSDIRRAPLLRMIYEGVDNDEWSENGKRSKIITQRPRRMGQPQQNDGERFIPTQSCFHMSQYLVCDAKNHRYLLERTNFFGTRCKMTARISVVL